MDKMIQTLYRDINISKWEDFQERPVRRMIAEISDELGLPVHFYGHPSELNNMGGTWRVFLNENQCDEKLWQDFGKVVGIYVCHQLFLEGKAVHQLCDFPYYFCVPSFLLRQLPLVEKTEDKQWITGEITRIFHVESSFAETRIQLFCAS
ncbi:MULTISPECIES: hypothetical protein [Bacillaceae]|uniref:hypothetical protein n=1 Tax=Bacillaceae TaxID=186817 RepID=UPI0006934EBD|nr:hypothetical protein [Bacillus rubiinfantis]